MNLTATAENGRARIELKGTISKWRETEAEFTSKVEQLIRSGIKDVHIYINSPGGECFEANEIVNVIKKFPGKITGEGGALVASAATYIAINCTRIPVRFHPVTLYTAQHSEILPYPPPCSSQTVLSEILLPFRSLRPLL